MDNQHPTVEILPRHVVENDGWLTGDFSTAALDGKAGHFGYERVGDLLGGAPVGGADGNGKPRLGHIEQRLLGDYNLRRVGVKDGIGARHQETKAPVEITHNGQPLARFRALTGGRLRDHETGRPPDAGPQGGGPLVDCGLLGCTDRRGSLAVDIVVVAGKGRPLVEPDVEGLQLRCRQPACAHIDQITAFTQALFGIGIAIAQHRQMAADVLLAFVLTKVPTHCRRHRRADAATGQFGVTGARPGQDRPLPLFAAHMAHALKGDAFGCRFVDKGGEMVTQIFPFQIDRFAHVPVGHRAVTGADAGFNRRTQLQHSALASVAAADFRRAFVAQAGQRLARHRFHRHPLRPAANHPLLFRGGNRCAAPHQPDRAIIGLGVKGRIAADPLAQHHLADRGDKVTGNPWLIPRKTKGHPGRADQRFHRLAVVHRTAPGQLQVAHSSCRRRRDAIAIAAFITVQHIVLPVDSEGHLVAGHNVHGASLIGPGDTQTAVKLGVLVVDNGNGGWVDLQLFAQQGAHGQHRLRDNRLFDRGIRPIANRRLNGRHDTSGQ